MPNAARLYEKIKLFATLPQTGVTLNQIAQFGTPVAGLITVHAGRKETRVVSVVSRSPIPAGRIAD